MSFRTQCPACGAVAPADVFSPFCAACGNMNDVEYDLDGVVLHDSPNPYLRYRELLPVRDPSLFPQDAGTTPTVHATRLGERVGLPWLYLKDETKLPTGTTKDRMAAVALPYLCEGGVEGFCTSSTGNSSTAYAHAITSVRGLQMYLFTAEQFIHRVDVPDGDRVVNFGLRDATFVEAFDAARDYAIANGLTSERGFFNPGRREGLKVAWLEAAEQVPRPIDWYVQAVSSAMGVYGVHRAAVQLHAIGVTDRVPRLLCVQQETCAPMVSAWNDGAEAIRPQDIVERPAGIASAILRGNPTRAYPPVRRIVLDTGGTMVAVSEADIRNARDVGRGGRGDQSVLRGGGRGRGHGEAAPPGRARPERDRAREPDRPRPRRVATGDDRAGALDAALRGGLDVREPRRRGRRGDPRGAMNAGVPGRTLLEILAARSAAAPASVAVRDDDRVVTHGELASRSDLVARAVVQQLGVGSEPVGVLVPTGVDAIVAILGVIKAGKAALPLDDDAPAAEVERAVAHAGRASS